MKKKTITIRIRIPGVPIVKKKVREYISVNEVISDILHTSVKSLIFSINEKKASGSSLLKDNDILSIGLTTRNEATVRCNGKNWRVYSYDKDDLFPSDFHAHNIEKPEKLDLYTGIIYNPNTSKLLYKLHKKDWIAILIKLKASKEKNISSMASDILLQNQNKSH